MAHKHSNTKLERAEFTSAIKKGLGRAQRHVINFGLDGVDDLVLDACLHNYCYDTQIETSRASWLFSMFVDSEYYAKFSEAILDGLRTQTDRDNLLQLSALAGSIAKRGNENARQRLREFVFEVAARRSPNDWLGAYDWIGLEGTQGFLDLARIYGQRLLQDRDDFVPDDIIHEDETEHEFKEALFQFAETDSPIMAYKEYLEARGVFKERPASIDKELIKQQQHERIRKAYSLEGILEDARHKRGEIPVRYMQFGKHATPAELQTVYEQLFVENDPDVLLRLLWVFRRTPMPSLDKKIFDWAQGTEPKLRAAAIYALARLSDPQVHDLAISKVRAGELLGADNDALDLFLNNFEADDIQLITQALHSLKPDREDAHSLGFSILDLAEKWAKAEWAEALEWVYENTPCANCRRGAVEQLHEWQKLDKAMLDECQFDAEESIRDVASKILEGQQ